MAGTHQGPSPNPVAHAGGAKHHEHGRVAKLVCDPRAPPDVAEREDEKLIENITHCSTYNLNARRINRARSVAVPGNNSRAWPKYLKMIDIVTGEAYLAAPIDREAIHNFRLVDWALLGTYYELPWVPAGPGATRKAECRRDYKAFIGMLAN